MLRFHEELSDIIMEKKIENNTSLINFLQNIDQENLGGGMVLLNLTGESFEKTEDLKMLISLIEIIENKFKDESEYVQEMGKDLESFRKQLVLSYKM